MGGSQAVKNTKQTAEKSDVIASVKEPTLEEKLATENAAFLSGAFIVYLVDGYSCHMVPAR